MQAMWLHIGLLGQGIRIGLMFGCLVWLGMVIKDGYDEHNNGVGSDHDEKG